MYSKSDRQILITLVAVAAVVFGNVPSGKCQETNDAAKQMMKAMQQVTGKKPQEKTELQVDLFDYPIAILPFKERGKTEGKDQLGQKVTDLTFAEMVVDPELHLVDREDLEAVLSEMELSLSGLTNPDTAVKIGNLTGAKLLVTGSVFELDDSIYVVGKIIGTETSRVVGASAKGPSDGDVGELVEKLAKEIVASVRKNASLLIVEQPDPKTRFENLAKSIMAGAIDGKTKLPVIFVEVAEQHIGRTTFDPAAETEFTTILRQCGFEVLDSKLGKKSNADLILSGEGISEYASRMKNLNSVKSRVEIKLVDGKSGKIIFSDRQTSLAIDLAENIAGKKALQKAAADIAERMLSHWVKSK
jgi:curli biogenesis system outer membrane secretion channel CsgG